MAVAVPAVGVMAQNVAQDGKGGGGGGAPQVIRVQAQVVGEPYVAGTQNAAMPMATVTPAMPVATATGD